MEKLIALIETMKPFFETVSKNPYLRAIRDGFISCIPVVLFSSLFILVACVPEIFGFKWPDNISALLWQAYGYSMGILAVLMVATIGKSLTDNINNTLPKLRQINSVSVMIVAIICFLLLSVESVKGGLSTEFMGTKGLLSAFVVAFIVPNIYKFFVKRNITIKMPYQVPHNISQTFADLIPLAVSILAFWAFDIWFKDEKNINAYISELANLNIKVEFYSNFWDDKSTENIYGFSNKKYTFKFEDVDYNQIVFIVDIVCNKSFPCNDFYANSLILVGNEVCQLDKESLTCESIITMINNNQMYVKPEFLEKVKNIISSTDENIKFAFLIRLIKFQNRGWDLGEFKNHLRDLLSTKADRNNSLSYRELMSSMGHMNAI